MYIPPAFRLADHAAALEVMRRHPFALLVVATGAGETEIAHLPLMIDIEGEGDGAALWVRGHVAKANPIARLIAVSSADAPVRSTAVFAGPNAYVSPDWYATEHQVPTWNYLAVHASGPLAAIDAPDAVDAVLADLSAVHEAALAPKRPWTMDKMPDGLIERMRKGLTAFRFPVDRLEPKAKLSQNKGAADRDGVIAALDALGSGDAAATAEWMRRLAG